MSQQENSRYCRPGGKWWQTGQTPDYRFTLANERTFLAWIRTALALMAGAVGIDQFSTQLGSPLLRQGLALLLVCAGALMGGIAWRRWRKNEYAMRLARDLPYTRYLFALAAFIVMLALLLACLFLQGRGAT
ncbi:DUF202 domain-containing protein [Cronobacter sakazakii]